MTIRYKEDQGPAGWKDRTEKELPEDLQETVQDNGTPPKGSAVPGNEPPSQACEAVIGLPESTDKVKSSNNRSPPPQQPAQSPSLAHTATESVRIAHIDIKISLMSDQSNHPDKQQEGPASDEPKSRSDAVTLLRARTASRSTLTDSSNPVDSSQSREPSHADDNPQSAATSHTPATTTEPTSSSKKDKKKKAKKKYKKLDLAEFAPNISSPPHRRRSHTANSQSNAQVPESEPQTKRDDLCDIDSSSAQSKCSPKVDSPSHTKETKPVDYSAAVKGYNSQGKHVLQAEKKPQAKGTQSKEPTSEKNSMEVHDLPATQSKSARSNKKGKRRVARVNPVTGDEIPEEPQGSSCLPAPSTPIASIENGVKGITLDQSTTEPPAAATAILTPPPRSAQSSRRGTNVHMREKLSTIQETAGDTDNDVKDLTSETRSLLTSTPKSSTTIWSNLGPQATPQSERSTLESDENSHRRHGSSGKSQATASGQSQTSHAHPVSPARSEQSTLTAPSTQGSVSRQKPEDFFWQLDSHGFPCAMSGCDKRCNLWDGATVICARCGPYSELRYCCKEHMFQDVKWHWLYCEQMTFEHPCRESSIPRQVREGPPMVPCIHPYDTPERHRQAVRFSADTGTGDYFIFSDWADLVAARFPENNLDVRCSHRVIYVIKFDDPIEKDRFRRVLATCLFLTIDVHELVDYLFRLIRDKLRSEGRAQELEVAVKYQFQSEFNVTIQDLITGTRHACETDWNGKNRRNCPDASCRAEYRRLLGSPPGGGHGQLIDHLEGTYWILRTARTTHPNVSSIIERMRGEGFDQVADEDRRVFRRGEGWDGAGTGDMEIEDMNA